MINPAWAQAASSGGQAPALMQFAPLVLIFGVFYLLVIRPQQQKQKEQRLMLANLKRNDEVVTTGGLYGKVVALADKVVTLEIAPNVRVRIDRTQVNALVNGPRATADDGTKDKEKEKAK